MAPMATRSSSSSVNRPSQPRRKTSASVQQRRGSSSELVEHDDAAQSIEQDAMEVDGSSIFDPANVEAELHPLREMADRVGKEVELFAEELDKYRPQMQTEDPEEKQEAALGLVREFQNIAEGAVERLRRKHADDARRMVQRRHTTSSRYQRSFPHLSDDEAGLNDLSRWQDELNTWNLVYDLLQCEFGGLESTALIQDHDRFAADGQYWADFLGSNQSGQERLTVLKWLESTAEKTGNDIEIFEQQLEDQTARTTFDGWMDTRERIKSEKRLRIWETPLDSNAANAPKIRSTDGSAQIVHSLDPDVMTRQDLTLEKDDLKSENSLWIMIWELLRRGTSMDKVREWCADRGQHAIAFSIGAHADETTQVPSRRFLWRQACYRLSRATGVDKFEHAVYGLTSGDKRSLEPVCDGWHDFLYLEYNSLLLRQYEFWLATTHGDMFTGVKSGSFRLPAAEATQDDPVEEARSINQHLQSEDRSKYGKRDFQQQIQGALVTHTIPQFTFQHGVAASRAEKDIDQTYDQAFWRSILPAASRSFPNDGQIPGEELITDDPDALRVLAHIFLLFKELGHDFGLETHVQGSENILISYLEYLKMAGKYNLMPSYAARLSSYLSLDVLARTCPFINDENAQQEFVNLMTEAGINVIDVLHLHVDLNFDLSPFTSPIAEDTTPCSPITLMRPEPNHHWPYQRVSPLDPATQALTLPETRLIAACRWYALSTAGWAETFNDLTTVALAFLKNSRVKAAAALVEAMPCAETSLQKSAAFISRSVDIMDDHEGSDDEVTPELRRSSRRRRRSSGPFSSGGRRAMTPDEAKIRRDLLKAHVRTYHELEQLVTALQALLTCGHLETLVVDLASAKDAERRNLAKRAKGEHRTAVDDLVHAMEPLLHTFLENPPPYVPKHLLADLRTIYLPEMVLSYAACLHAAGYLQSREHLLQCLDLATNVADNEGLIGCFREARAPGYERRGQIGGEWDDGRERDGRERAGLVKGKNEGRVGSGRGKGRLSAESAGTGSARESSGTWNDVTALLDGPPAPKGSATSARFTSPISKTQSPTDGEGSESGDNGKGTGRMKELVDGMASASKAILELNEMNPKGGKKRGRSGRTLGIWDGAGVGGVVGS